MGEAAKRDVGVGVNQLPAMNSFYSIRNNSYLVQMLPTGTIMQFYNSSAADSDGVALANYPIPFPNAALMVFVGELTSSGANGSVGVISWGECYDIRTKTGAKVRNNRNAQESCMCLAIGY